jgi:hypothetical protein
MAEKSGLDAPASAIEAGIEWCGNRHDTTLSACELSLDLAPPP